MSLLKSAQSVAVLVIASFVGSAASADKAAALSPQAKYAWLHMQGNLLAQERLLKLGELTPVDALITNVNVIDVLNGGIRNNAAVLVRDGTIVWVRDAEDAADVEGVVGIDGANQYLAPGLIDMHVHTHDDSDYLLQLAFGEE